MTEPIGCEFQVRLSDPLYKGKPKMESCGEDGCMCKVTGQLAEIVMPLCEMHRDHVMREYGWIVKPIVG